ncbi:hypothetical protein [Pseudoduganella sp. HUAS MS19]
MQANAELRPARCAWLAAVALMHAALFLCWRGTPYVRQAEVQRESELVYLQAPRERPKQPAAALAPAAPNAGARAARRSAPPPPVAVTAAAPAASATATPVADAVTVPATANDDPFAKPAAPTETLLEKNRRLAAGVDRQLRKESLNKFATIILPDTKLGMAIARSQTKDWVLEQTSDLGDGVTMKRYRKGNQEYCEYTNLVGARGQDPRRDWNKTKVMTCP